MHNVIFGFNTDIKYGETVYHVQSEVREHDTLLQTQVFVKGRCLGKYETSLENYSGQPDFDEDRLHDLLKAQHKHFVECARAGTIEDKIESGRGVPSETVPFTPPPSATGVFASPPRSPAPPVPSPPPASTSATRAFASPLNSATPPFASPSPTPEFEVSDEPSFAVPAEGGEADEEEDRISLSLGDDSDLAAIAEASAAAVSETEPIAPPPLRLNIDEVPAEPVEAPADTVLNSFMAELEDAEKQPPPPPLPQFRVDPAGSLIGKGIGLDCQEPIVAPDGADVLVNVQVSEGDDPLHGAQITCRISVPNGPAAYVYSTSNANGIADLRIATHGLAPATGILIQASIHGKSASRKFTLRRM